MESTARRRIVMFNFMLKMVTSPEVGMQIVNDLRTVVGPARSIPGCTSFRIYMDKDDPDVVLLLSQWCEEEDLKRFVQTADFRRILIMMESASKTPDLSIQNVSSTRGMEYIREILESNTD
jgi:quinol monooxygenase YgiN